MVWVVTWQFRFANKISSTVLHAGSADQIWITGASLEVTNCNCLCWGRRWDGLWEQVLVANIIHYLTPFDLNYTTLPFAPCFPLAAPHWSPPLACRDCNGAKQTGFMLPQATIRRAARCSTAKVNMNAVFSIFVWTDNPCCSWVSMNWNNFSHPWLFFETL